MTVPKVDSHVHQERFARLDRVLARRERRPPFDWDAWRRDLTTRIPAGVARLRALQSCFPVSAAADDDEAVVERITDLLCDAGALLVEPRFGNETALRPDFFAFFREAERRARERYPVLVAEPVVVFKLWQPETDRMLATCVRAAGRGELIGVDLLYEPYDAEADWRSAQRIARELAAAGVRLTVHAGEFSPANIDAALRLPGLTRLGHATQVLRAPRTLDRLAASGIAVEVCLTSNVVLGAVERLEEHPLPRLVEHGVPVVLGTDDPVALGTTIAREYELAARLGLTADALLNITRTAIGVAFTTEDRRAALTQAVCDQMSRVAAS